MTLVDFDQVNSFRERTNREKRCIKKMYIESKMPIFDKRLPAEMPDIHVRNILLLMLKYSAFLNRNYDKIN